MRIKTVLQLISAVFIVIIIGKYVIVAQDAVTGRWKADAREGSSKIHLSFSRDSVGDRKNQFGTEIEYSELKGLTHAQTSSGSVSFKLVREAGTIECEGSFTDGRGSGTYTFKPNMAFVDAMRGRGFDLAATDAKTKGSLEDRLFTAAALNVTTALADDLLAANFGKLEVEDLFKAAIFKIDGKFMAEMKSTGFPNLGMEDLVKARIFKIDPSYVREVAQMGFEDRDFEDLVKFRIFNVTPEFLSELKREGLDGLSAEDVVKFRIFKIDPEFVRQAKAENPKVTVEELVEIKIGVRKRTK